MALLLPSTSRFAKLAKLSKGMIHLDILIDIHGCYSFLYLLFSSKIFQRIVQKSNTYGALS